MPSATAPRRSPCSAMPVAVAAGHLQDRLDPFARQEVCGGEAGEMRLCAAPSVTLTAVASPRRPRAAATNADGSVATGGESSAVRTKVAASARASSLTASSLPEQGRARSVNPVGAR